MSASTTPSQAKTKVKVSKPSVSYAMAELIHQVRDEIPFDIPTAELCKGPCKGCPKKLLEYLDMELEDWEGRLNNSEQPRLGDIQRLARRSKKIYRSLEKNGLLDSSDSV